ncbi:MAG: TRAP transporter small permease subunit [Cyclobacteriaceae bacterium]
MKQLSSAIENFIERTGKVVSWLSFILVVIIGFDVLFRYAFNQSTAALFELEWHLFAVLFMIGAAYTLKHDKHVRVDVFYTRFSTKKKAWVNLIGTVFFLIPFCIVVIKTSIPFVMASHKIMESSADPGGLPYRYIIKSTIPIGTFLLLLQAISELLKSLLIISSPSSEYD